MALFLGYSFEDMIMTKVVFEGYMFGACLVLGVMLSKGNA
jgi:hypothetical protein